MKSTRVLWFCSITVLLSAALLPASSGTQALGNPRMKDLSTEEDVAKEIILGVRAVEPPEEAEISRDVEPGSKVVSGSAWARWVARQAQAGPEQDLDHLHHSRDDAGKPDAYGPPLMLSLQVQNGPEEDHDHLHHH